MLFLDVERDGDFLRTVRRVVSAVIDHRINAADTVRVDHIDILGDSAIKTDDVITLRDDDVTVGMYTVVDVEGSLSGDDVMSRVSGIATAAHLLRETAIPDIKFINDIPLATAEDRLASLVSMQRGREIEFSSVNAASSTPNIKDRDAINGLEALGQIVIPSNSKWRCRADMAVPTIETGTFGEWVPVELKGGRGALGAPNGYAQYLYSTATYVESAEDLVTGGFAEGGSFMHTAIERTLKLGDLGLGYVATPLPGWTLRNAALPDGVLYYWLEKNISGRQRLRRVRVGSIAPADMPGGGDPDVPTMTAAAQSLLETFMQYVDLYCEPKRTWKVIAPASMLSQRFFAGDKIYLNIVDGIGAHSGWVYVISHQIRWQSGGGIESELELCDRLDSLGDPLSGDFLGTKTILES